MWLLSNQSWLSSSADFAPYAKRRRGVGGSPATPSARPKLCAFKPARGGTIILDLEEFARFRSDGLRRQRPRPVDSPIEARKRFDPAITSVEQFERCDVVVASVIVASKPGLTPPYSQLHALYSAHVRQEEVLASPHQLQVREPGNEAETSSFCSTDVRRDLPDVLQDECGRRGPAPALRRATALSERPRGPPTQCDLLRGYGITPNEDPDILWNFEKFLAPATAKSPPLRPSIRPTTPSPCRHPGRPRHFSLTAISGIANHRFCDLLQCVAPNDCNL